MFVLSGVSPLPEQFRFDVGKYMMSWEQDWLQLICLSIERQHVKLSSADKLQWPIEKGQKYKQYSTIH
jgi:hypothetical protein